MKLRQCQLRKGAQGLWRWCLLCEHEDLTLVPRMQRESKAWLYVFLSQTLGRQRPISGAQGPASLPNSGVLWASKIDSLSQNKRQLDHEEHICTCSLTSTWSHMHLCTHLCTHAQTPNTRNLTMRCECKTGFCFCYLGLDFGLYECILLCLFFRWHII